MLTATALHAPSLDHRLADGEPCTDADLLHRAAVLASPRCRAGLACRLERLVAGVRPFAVVEPCFGSVDRRAVRAVARDLLAVAAALRGPDEVPVAAVARVRDLIEDPTSVLHRVHASHALRAEVDALVAAFGARA